MTDLQTFERSMLDEIQAFSEGKPWAPSRKAPEASVNTDQIVVRLAVRAKRLAPDIEFVHYSNKLSKLEAQLDAEKAARQSGWPIIGFVIDIEKH